MSLPAKFILLFTIGFGLTQPSFAFKLRQGAIPIQVGGFISSPGITQDIYINGLVGNRYSVSNDTPAGWLVGLGYYLDGLDKNHVHLSYGVNAFYLNLRAIKGNIAQEHLYTNLAYSYNIETVPIYLASKATIKNNNEKYNFTIDAGFGPNFMHTNHYKETPLNIYTTPDNAFSSHTGTTFTAMAGIGVRFKNIIDKAPLECGYRFFYLGQGQLQAINNQLLNTIKTGHMYANALLCSITV